MFLSLYNKKLFEIGVELGTVGKLIEQFAQNAFLSAKKKTQAMRASARLFDAAIGKAGKQIVQVN